MYLSNNVVSTVKIFVDDASLFSTVHDSRTSACKLNKDLRKNSEWAYQWKMSFNSYLSKQAQEVIFSRKTGKLSH